MVLTLIVPDYTATYRGLLNRFTESLLSAALKALLGAATFILEDYPVGTLCSAVLNIGRPGVRTNYCNAM